MLKVWDFIGLTDFRNDVGTDELFSLIFLFLRKLPDRKNVDSLWTQQPISSLLICTYMQGVTDYQR